MSVLSSLLRRRARVVVLAVAAAVLATGCGRNPGPDVVVVSGTEESSVGGEIVTQIELGPLGWPQTIGLLCNHADVLRAIPDCLPVFGPQIESSMSGVVASVLEIEGAVDVQCASGPEAMRAGLDVVVLTSEEQLLLQMPGANDFDVKMAQTLGVAGYLAVIETQCSDRFADAGIVAREVVVDYEL